jgi:stearoyl-CoA desaturase (delta-9 desaturase)
MTSTTATEVLHNDVAVQPDEDELAGLDPELRKRVEMNKKPGPFGFQAQIVWFNIFTISFVHVLGAMGLVAAVYCKWYTLLSYCFFYYFSGLGVTAGAHRLWAHKTYKARLPLKIILMLFNCAAFQNDIYQWARDHRLHHKYSETDADPHNAKRGFFFAHMGWLMMKKHPQVLIKGKNVDMSDLRNDPVVMFQKRHYLKLSLVMAVIIPTFIPTYFWNESPVIAFLFCGAFRYVSTLHITWLVNSAAHMWGYRPYDKTINPAENLFVSLSAIGEGFHNYHHTFPYDYSTSEWGPYFNVTTMTLDFCSLLGLVYDRKQVSSEAIERVKKRLGTTCSISSSNDTDELNSDY